MLCNALLIKLTHLSRSDYSPSGGRVRTSHICQPVACERACAKPSHTRWMIFSVAAPSMAVLFDKRSNRAANKGLVSATLLKNGVPTVTPQIAHINLSTALIIPGEHGTNWRHAMEKPLLWRVWITNKVVPTRVCRFSDLQFTHQCMFIKSCASTHGTWKQAVAQGRTQPERLSV